MTDPWDAMIEGDDAETQAEIVADAKSYLHHVVARDEPSCRIIEEKYGLVGLTQEQVSQHLAEMALTGGAS